MNLRSFAVLTKTRTRRILLGFLLFLLAFGLFGYFALPGIIRAQLEKTIGEKLHRQVSIERISVNPHWLSVTIHKFKTMEPNGKDVFLSFDQFRVSLSPESVLRFAPVIRSVKLSNPYLHIRRNSNGVHNIDDILAFLSGGDDSPSSARFGIGRIRIAGGSFTYEDDFGTQPMYASLKQFDLRVQDLDVDLGNREIVIGEITSNNAVYHIQNKKRKSLQPMKATTSSRTAKSKKTSPLHVEVGRASIKNWAAKFEDRHLEEPAITKLTRISVEGKNISSDLRSSNDLTFSARIDGTGKVRAHGVFSVSPLKAKLDLAVQDANITGLQAYFTNRLNFLFTSANFSSKGRFTVNEEKSGHVAASYEGNLALNDVKAVGKLSGRPLLRWKSLQVNDIQASLHPPSLHIDNILLERYFARLTVSPEGRLNMQDLIVSDNQATAASAEPVPEPQIASIQLPQKSEAAAAKTPFPVSIKNIIMKGGRVHFTDNFIKPHYNARLTRLNGSITGLSSDKNHAAAINLQGNFGHAPMLINGEISPLADDLYLDIHAEIHGIELPTLSAYSSKYTGYGIEKGQLSFEVQYQVRDRHLTASNKLILNQLKFLEPNAHSDSDGFPLQLAVSVLRDRNDVIDIELPVRGSLDDPEFSVGAVIGQTFINMLGKAITSPFALLSSVFGSGDEELGWVEFKPGEFRLDEAGEQKLALLSKALNDRPALKMDITGMAAAEVDIVGLKKNRLERQLRMQKIKNREGKQQTEQVRKVEINAREYPALLKQVYRQENSVVFGLLSKSSKAPGVAQMEKELLEKIKVTDDDLVALATQRAVAAKAWLVAQGKVPTSRIFILAGRQAHAESDPLKGKTAASRVEFTLKN